MIEILARSLDALTILILAIGAAKDVKPPAQPAAIVQPMEVDEAAVIRFYTPDHNLGVAATEPDPAD